jgi:hypothetical protein
VASAPAEVRTLQSGRGLATLSVRVHGPATPTAGDHDRQPATSVPVAVWDPPAWVDDVDVDAPLVVVGGCTAASTAATAARAHASRSSRR